MAHTLVRKWLRLRMSSQKKQNAIKPGPYLSFTLWVSKVCCYIVASDWMWNGVWPSDSCWCSRATFQLVVQAAIWNFGGSSSALCHCSSLLFSARWSSSFSQENNQDASFSHSFYWLTLVIPCITNHMQKYSLLI